MVKGVKFRMPQDYIDSQIRHCHYTLGLSFMGLVALLFMQATPYVPYSVFPVQQFLWLVMVAVWYIGYRSICHRDYLESL